jgi:Predicted membrane protein
VVDVDKDLHGLIRAAVSRGRCMTVNQLVEVVSREAGLPRSWVAYEVYLMWKRGELNIEHEPLENAVMFLASVDGVWYWVTLAIALASLAVVMLVKGGPLMPIRYLLGAVSVLFMPGYSIVEALYPRGDELAPLERLALSIGLSLAVVPLVGLILNYTPWGIRLIPIVVSNTALTIALLTVAALRKARYASTPKDCFT